MQWQRLVVTFTCAVLGTGFQIDSVPTKMTHVIAQMSGTDIPADSFAAKPKGYWRASNQFCRVDEGPDPANGVHGIMIMNEPNIWLINLADGTAKHFIDPGPTFNCKLPIFATDTDSAKSKIGELEFGRELEFFHANGAESVAGPQLEFKASYYELTIGDSVLKLVERVEIHAPILIALIHGGKVLQVRYLLWDDQARLRPISSQSRPVSGLRRQNKTPVPQGEPSGVVARREGMIANFETHRRPLPVQPWYVLRTVISVIVGRWNLGSL